MVRPSRTQRTVAGEAARESISPLNPPDISPVLFQRIMSAPVDLELTVNNATARTASLYGLGGYTNENPRIYVPKTFYVTAGFLSAKTGATAGTYTIDLILYDHNSATTHVVTSADVVGANTWLRTATVNPVKSPILQIASGALLSVGWRNNSASPGALANRPHTAKVCGYMG